ncbi:MAG TPA: hypothetical protein VLH08_08265 [Acidobacteriota bacterium]|nr:hypothetical protein [Acidobacteriota bacterium]
MDFAKTATAAIADPMKFWQQNVEAADSHEALRYSFVVSFFVFAGFLFHYTITGQIWNYYPFEHTTLTVGRAIPCAIVQWMLYATFPAVNTFLMDATIFRKSTLAESKQRLIVVAYALTPLCISWLFVGVPFLHKPTVVLGLAIFAYSLFFGYRILLGYTLLRSAILTGATYVLYEIFRQIVTYLIGF